MSFLRRFEVAERSMAPALLPGDYLVASSRLGVRPSDLVVFEHPARAGFWLVKRVERISDEGLWVLSDDPEVTRADSRTLGAIPPSDVHRVVLRYWPPHRITARFPKRATRL